MKLTTTITLPTRDLPTTTVRCSTPVQARPKTPNKATQAYIDPSISNHRAFSPIRKAPGSPCEPAKQTKTQFMQNEGQPFTAPTNTRLCNEALPADVNSNLYLAIHYARWHWDRDYMFPRDVEKCARAQWARVVGGEDDGEYVE